MRHKMYGLMTGLNWYLFMDRVEQATGDAVDWTTVKGNTGDPWPPDLWIEGNNGRGSMRLNYKGHRTEFTYSDYISGEEFDSEQFMSDVGDWLDRQMRDDPYPWAEGSRT
ncbi:hypothetical protein [Glycomyces xiaoerkulensis]|uniref:hypothetical protein n=1 Tax=Glycomyces xiaoerkulensis TaxID=2038139 RepID=UPI000C262090|nr:hypothetical protein [Glycomyces xiaoerkulensis]